MLDEGAGADDGAGADCYAASVDGVSRCCVAWGGVGWAGRELGWVKLRWVVFVLVGGEWGAGRNGVGGWGEREGRGR